MLCSLVGRDVKARSTTPCPVCPWLSKNVMPYHNISGRTVAVDSADFALVYLPTEGWGLRSKDVVCAIAERVALRGVKR